MLYHYIPLYSHDIPISSEVIAVSNYTMDYSADYYGDIFLDFLSRFSLSHQLYNIYIQHLGNSDGNNCSW